MNKLEMTKQMIGGGINCRSEVQHFSIVIGKLFYKKQAKQQNLKDQLLFALKLTIT